MKVLYFAWLRTRVGRGEEEVAPPPDVLTVGQLMAWLKTTSPAHAAAFSESALVRAAVDLDYAGLDHPIAGAREVAFFPPVTGGTR